MSAHSDPLQHDNTDGTAGGALKKTKSPRRFGVSIPPFGNPPIPEVTGGRTASVPTVTPSGTLEEWAVGRDAGGVRPPSLKDPGRVHNFTASKAAGSLGPCQLEALFRQTVPGFRDFTAATFREDLDGVDYWLTVEGEPRLVPCQLKLRPWRRKLDDLLIELASVGPRRVAPGWIMARPATVFLYVVPLARRALVMDGRELHAAWRKHGAEWVSTFGVRTARNAKYLTLSCPVHVREILAACPSARVVEVRL